MESYDIKTYNSIGNKIGCRHAQMTIVNHELPLDNMPIFLGDDKEEQKYQVWDDIPELEYSSDEEEQKYQVCDDMSGLEPADNTTYRKK